ncbi:hypothetical protein A3H26_03300 [candidate division WWE3 bacterium RIFCSPLOWO2_12_FULL_36_10]|uniref:Uncharacterized protein n=1 Tax=candidate division WWE3 bacterium RIFCSPLOWO2_12_FULL_36_10 TaxID=1802630 RepID=A0A1F4VK88_UNCKA|nr:MAG: hypothetical protein A3H26_03300 [candidate division WWE3 bacterium RIFCSPLOWO2_12_FULL_36_10]
MGLAPKTRRTSPYLLAGLPAGLGAGAGLGDFSTRAIARSSVGRKYCPVWFFAIVLFHLLLGYISHLGWWKNMDK